LAEKRVRVRELELVGPLELESVGPLELAAAQRGAQLVELAVESVQCRILVSQPSFFASLPDCTTNKLRNPDIQQQPPAPVAPLSSQ